MIYIKDKNLLKLIRNTNFRWLILSEIISLTGSNLHYFAIMWYISTKYGSASSIGGYVITSMIPYVLFGSFAGLASDMFDKKKVMCIVNIINGFLILSLLFFVYIDNLSIYYIYAISFLMTTLDLFFSPAKYSMIPILVQEEDLLGANSLLTSVNEVLRVVLPVFSGMISSLFNLKIVFTVDSISYFLAAICIYKIYYVENNIKKASHSSVREILKELKLGFNYIIESKVIILVLLISIILNIVTAPVSTLSVLFIQDILGLDVKFFGILEAALSIGFIIGTAILNCISKKKFNDIHIIIIGCVLLCIGMSAFSMSKVFQITLVSYLVIGIAMCITSVAAMTIKQKAIPQELMGRVLGISDVIVMFFMSMSVGVTGILADYIGLRYIFMLSGLSVILLIALITIYKKKLLKE
ncbi:MAG: MFS transporter [Clostridium sp.]|nr:MFS transporter [Clostridium sp.]